MVQLLFYREAVAVNHVNNDGYTTFITAAHQGYLPGLQLLLDREAAVNKAMADDKTPLFIAAPKGYLPGVQLLLD